MSDSTLSWRGVWRLWVNLLHKGDNPSTRKDAELELERMAAMADILVELSEKVGGMENLRACVDFTVANGYVVGYDPGHDQSTTDGSGSDRGGSGRS